MRHARLPLLALAALTVTGCDDDTIAVETVQACDGPVTVQVSAGRTPTITWTPACSVQQLVVFQPLSEAGEKWRIASQAGINPGVRYGVVPRGASQPTAPIALVSGQEAAVELIRLGTEQPAVIGGASFTP